MDLYAILMGLSLLLIPLLLVLKTRKQRQQLPPGPPKLPILGNLLHLNLGPVLHQSFWKLSQKYGPVMLLKAGRMPLVVISSPEAAREVMKVQDVHCCSRPNLTGTRLLSYDFLDVSFTPYNDQWRQLRKLYVNELFTPKKIQSFRFLREEEVASLVKSISQAASSANPVNLSQEIYKLSGSIVFRMAFGTTLQGSNFDVQNFIELIDESMTVGAGFTAEECFPYIGWIIDWLTGYHAKIDRVCQKLDSFYEQIIKNHLEPGETERHQDIVDVMLQMEKDQSDSGYGLQIRRGHIKALLMNMFLAGVDTSAILIVWVMAELARNPKVMKKAQDEVRKYIGKTGIVTENDIDKLPYLDLIIREGLRVHPPAPTLLPREVVAHCKVNGYDINPNTMMFVNVWAIGRDSRYWENPEDFIPERFIDKTIDFRGQHFEYLPFGSGRRVCPGMNLGLTAVKLALANLLYNFDWKLPNNMDVKDLNMEESNGQKLTIPKKVPLILEPINYLHQI